MKRKLLFFTISRKWCIIGGVRHWEMVSFLFVEFPPLAFGRILFNPKRLQL
jgi:hypothetical protein